MDETPFDDMFLPKSGKPQETKSKPANQDVYKSPSTQTSGTPVAVLPLNHEATSQPGLSKKAIAGWIVSAFLSGVIFGLVTWFWR